MGTLPPNEGLTQKESIENKEQGKNFDRASHPFHIDIPQFFSSPSRAHLNDRNIVSLEMPVFTASAVVAMTQNSEDRPLQMPGFVSSQPPRSGKEGEVSIIIPSFSQKISTFPEIGLPDDLTMPEFFPSEVPRSEKRPEASISLPRFSAMASPSPLPLSSQELLSLPNLVNADIPKIETEYDPSIHLPRFLPEISPLSNFAQPSPFLEAPNFVSPKDPIARNARQKRLKIPADGEECNPVVKSFDGLSRCKSYEDIVEVALKLDSLSDIRMLRQHSLLKVRYLKTLFNQLIDLASSLLPHSGSFKVKLENDQEQIDLFTKFCGDLIDAKTVEMLKLSSHPILDRLFASSPLPHDEEVVRQKGLLELKDFLYCFISEISLQERKAAEKLGAVQKDLTALSQALSLLRLHIQSTADEIRMQVIRLAAHFDFTPWEDRTPLAPVVVKVESPQVALDEQKLQKGLADIQGAKPKVWQLQDFTNQVLSLPEGDLKEATYKGKYLLELGKIYAKYPTVSALKRAIAWIDQAIDTLARFADKGDPILLECYDCRGGVWLQIAKLVKKVSVNEEALVRKRMDICYRDFYRAYTLHNSREKNFVRQVSAAKEKKDLNQAIREISEAIEMDEDYAEAWYLDFLKQFEQLQLDSQRLLHPTFARLRGEPPQRVFREFAALLGKNPATDPVFKVVLSSGTAVIKLDAQRLYLNRSGPDFLIEMLTRGCKSIEPLHTKKKKFYFSHHMAADAFCQLVQSLGNYAARFREMEKGIRSFHAFELSAFYKSSLVIEKEELESDSIRKRLDPNLILRLIEIESMALQSYLRLGEITNTQEFFAAALFYACRVIRDFDRLLLYTEEKEELESKKLALLIKKAVIYQRMELWNAHTLALEEAIELGKKNNPRFLNPSLHYSLGVAYKRLNQFEEAQDQLYIALSSKKGSIKAFKTAIEAELATLEDLRKSPPTLPPDDPQIMGAFQDQNILEECLQILRDHFKANSPGEPRRPVAYWNHFVQRIHQTTTIKDFCEAVLSSVLVSEKVSSENFLRIARLANLNLKDLKILDELKGYLLDAEKAYIEEESKRQDKIVEDLEEAKEALSKAEAFFEFKKKFIKKLREGERIRPGSLIRQKVLDLAAYLAFEKECPLKSLEEIMEEAVPADLQVEIDELDEVLQNALEIECSPPQVMEHVLQIKGSNIFLSQVKDVIEKTCGRRDDIQDVHIIGVNVYIDTSLTLPGINLAIGGEYVEFLSDKGGSGQEKPEKPLSIDLSGKGGKKGADLNLGRAADGRNPCDPGNNGLPGNHGEEGQSGGDFCISSKEPIIGLDPKIIQEINLCGGEGGKGSKGQDGGNGAKGIKGKDARTDIRKGDNADTMWGHIDVRRGKKGIPAGDGGQGGDEGVGGKGGAAGRLLIEQEIDTIKDRIKVEDGKDGENGGVGTGGKGGEGKPDGFDYAIVKGGLFNKQHKFSGYELYCKNRKKDRDQEGWADGITRDQTIKRNQGREKGRGKTANEQLRQRAEHKKQNLKRELFAENLNGHLHMQSFANKAYAFGEVTDQRAVAHDTEEIVKEQLNAKQKKIQDIETLHQQTSTLLLQAQSQHQTQKQHSRVGTFARREKGLNREKEIETFFNRKEIDQENLLPFRRCSPVPRVEERQIHELEYAMYEVNVTQAENMSCIARLIAQIVKYSKDPACLQDKRCDLINRLAKIIQQIPSRFGVEGFNQIVKACKGLSNASHLIRAIQARNLELASFKRIAGEEKLAINTAYETRLQELTIQRSILRFLSSDRLGFLILINKIKGAEKLQKEKWFKQRLYRKVVTIGKQAYGKELSQEQLNHFLQYADEKIAQLQGKIQTFAYKFPSKLVGQATSAERKNLGTKIKTLRQNQEWVLAHLFELIEGDILPSKVLMQGELDSLYTECSKRWASIQPPPSQRERPSQGADPSDKDKTEEPTPAQQAINETKKEEWSVEKKERLETHIKQLIEFKKEHAKPYLEHLRAVYAENREGEGLAEVFVAFILCGRELAAWHPFADELKTTDSGKIYALRNHYWQPLNNPSSELRTFHYHLLAYLQNRHLLLMKKKWIESFGGLGEEGEAFFHELADKVNKLYGSQGVLPNVDFFALATNTLEKNIRKISAHFEKVRQGINQEEKKNAEEVIAEFDIKDLILQRAVADQLGPLDIHKHKQLIDGLVLTLPRKEMGKIGAYLFLFLELNLSYGTLLHILKILEESQLSGEPIIKKGIFLLSQRGNLLKAKFEYEWEAVLNRAQFYDQIRKQVQKDDQSSIERLLFQIAEEANILPVDGKIETLSQIMGIMSARGCFTAFPELKALQNLLAAKVGLFPTSEGDIPQIILDYNRALETTFSSQEDSLQTEGLVPLFMKTIREMSFCAGFVAPSLIAIQHLPLSMSDLILLYNSLEQLKEGTDQEKEIKNVCLNRIRQLLIDDLESRYEVQLKKHGKMKQQLKDKQAEILTRVADVMKASNILHPDRHIATFKLWIKSLDFHFQADGIKDPQGQKRSKYYEDAQVCFFKEMGGEDSEKAITLFNQWLREKFNQLKGDIADVPALLDSIQEVHGQTPPQALEKLNRLWWRGTVPYSELLEKMEGKKIQEAAEKRLKLKFDETMIQEEYYEVKKKLEGLEETHEEDLKKWIQHIKSFVFSAKKMEQFYPNEETLVKAVVERQIPAYVALKQERGKPTQVEELSFEEWIKGSAHVKEIDEKRRSSIREYLEELEERITDEIVNSQDGQILKNLQNLFSRLGDPRLSSMKAKADELQLKLIDSKDDRNKQKEAKIKEFIGFLCEINSYDEFYLKNPRDKLYKQISKDKKHLESVLSSTCFLVGEELFLKVLQKLTDTLRAYRISIKLTTLSSLFWVLPRLKNPSVFFEILETKIPENWTITLLERYCLKMIQPSLAKMAVELPPLSLNGLADVQKEETIDQALQEKEKQSKECLNLFQATLASLISTPYLKSDDKEALLRLIGDRLAMLNQGKLEFPIESFTHLIHTYFTSPCALKKLSLELSSKHSIIANALFLPSFQGFKYGLTLAWMQGMLEPEILRLNKADRQKIYDSLLEIETVKKEQMMQKVVESLQGSLMVLAVVEGVNHFAQGSWELDGTTLLMLKNRTKTGAWYEEIAHYTKTKRSKPRDLAMLISLMAQESTGINSAIKDLLITDQPKLVKIIQEIKTLFNTPVKDWANEVKAQLGPYAQDWPAIKGWTAEQVTEWAIQEKSETFLNDPKRLMMGIAVVSRGNQLIEGHSLRDTQLIALWLMLRPTHGVPRGRISQMFTGEGKSITFACLAILRAMTRSHVDVITTSFVLAERDATQKEPLFKLFGLTVSNNCDLACESDDEERKKRYYQEGKPVDIVYGDVGAFERDLLLTEFHGQEIIHSSRMGDRRSVLVDEVDGLFLDNAGMVLYLSHNVDSLRFLERIFAQVWALANHPSFERALPVDDKAIEEISKVIRAKIDAEEIPLPQYILTNAKYMEIKSIIHRKLSIWVRSALYAKVLEANNEYIIVDQVVGGKKKKSVTVMDKGTGVEQFSLKWSNGLHQFLQFKHGLELSPESLKAVFLSNYFFFKRYGQHIYGLSGTLGSDTEQKYLQALYEVDLCKIPRFKGEKYLQHKAVVTGSGEEWLEQIAASVYRNVKELKRAVLIICESVIEVKAIEHALKKDYPLLQTYTSSLQELSFLSNDKPTPVGPGDVIIATNLAGRGTDLKTNRVLEDHGGLHVILSYLPPNIRIQEQGFGRTARSGNEGSGEFIILDPHRRPITALCRIRDMEEKQRLENVAIREVKKIEFENELLRGLVHNGEQIPGFQSLLDEIKEALKNEESFYREAQLSSLKNRWAFWIDHMDEKIALVHAIGKEIVLASFKKFQQGVREDFQRGDFRLIQEPIELIKLGGEYRRKEMWSEAESCYKKAAKDPHYAYAKYYKAACRLVVEPSSSSSAKRKFKAGAKRAIAAIRPEISQLQTMVQSVAPLVEQRPAKTGEPDYGNPYKARTEERIQIWSIFLSAIDEALGGTLTEESLKKSQYVTGENAGSIIKALGNRYRSTRLSKKLTIHADKMTYCDKTLAIPRMFRSVFVRLQGKREISKEILQTACEVVVTREKAEQLLDGKKSVVYKLQGIPPSFDKWPEGYSEGVKFVLSTLIDELRYEIFASHQEIKEKLTEKKQTSKLLKEENTDLFFHALVEGKLIQKDYKIDLQTILVKDPPKFKSFQEAKDGGFNERYRQLPKELQEALLSACCGREMEDTTIHWYLKTSIYLSELSLPNSTTEAADILWALLEEQHVLKSPKVKVGHKEYEKQIKNIEKDVKALFPDHKELDKVAESICGIIESSIGMIYKLESKKTTAKFADIIRKYYHDHSQHAPEGLSFFIELGLEVIADLIEKKDPPAWFEVLAVTVMGVIQMVAGAIIKAYLPIAGELIGNALMSTGMDDIMFAITSAVSGQFSWDDYAAAKVQSLKRSIISSAISCGVSFGTSVVKAGSFSQAWDVQKLSGAGKLAPGAFNLGNHVLKEVGRNFINMGISQLASRGLEGMAKLIAGSYEDKIKKEIQKAVSRHWSLVVTQALALYEKLGRDVSVPGKVEGCLNTLIQRTSKENFFEGVVRGSKQVLSHAGSVIGDNGWAEFLNHAPDLVNLGVSVAKLVNLVENNVHQFARDIRDTKEKNAPTSPSPSEMSKDAFIAKLDELKATYIEQLAQTFNDLLNSAVYAPLVSMGSKYLLKKGSELIPLSEQGKTAQSPEMLSKNMDAQNNPEEAFFDKIFRDWKHANLEVSELSDQDLQQTPVNSSETIETLKNQYGSLLKIYKDEDGNLYAQRPTRAEYAQGVMEGKVGGDPEIGALAKQAGKDIAIINPDGKIKTYAHTQEGTIRITESEENGIRNAPNTIYLKFEPNTATGVGHVAVENAANPANPIDFKGHDCLYEAVSQAAGLNKTIDQLRQSIAETLEKDPSFKRFYHDWSLSHEPKQFAGAALASLGTRLMAGVGVVGALREISIGASLSALTFATGVPTIMVGAPLLAHGVDNLMAKLQTLYAGEEVDSLATQFLEHTVGLSHTKARLLNDALGMVGNLGGSAIFKAAKAASISSSSLNEAVKFTSQRGLFNFSQTTIKHMDNPDRMVPIQLLKEVIGSPMGAPIRDPKGASSAMMYYSQITKNGKLYNIEVLYDKASNTILHFEYARKKMGPLERILIK
ncbi:hypothetical protein [Parachlamydia sp. AcF125]|uniref:hypothetical protein n=1 Tax=Parachlamydia sp. AcF125 TaxID=2795736 RepID=UPI001BC924FC|nr:hypothetical protein [Parachlamydia sp. AcF125]MBS4169097.1 Protein translocase subunit SecA [Parachlamydia sp. AcF125]